MFKKVFIFSVSFLFFLSGCETAANITNSESSGDFENYIVTEGTIIEGGIRKQTHFSIHTSEGEFVRKIDLPSDAVRSGANSNGVYGDKIYYLSGSEDITTIAEIDPSTLESTIFDFTESTAAEPDNVLYGITAWAVSSDNQLLAWVDTLGTLHIANRDGSVKSEYPMQSTRSVGQAWVGFSNDLSSLYVWRQGTRLLEKIKLSEEISTSLITSENGDFLISPTNRYIVYSNFEIPLAIRDLSNNLDVPITTPENYDGWYFDSFSPDESELYFSGFQVHKETDYFSVKTDGTNLTPIENERLQNIADFVSSSLAVIRCGDATCLIDFETGSEPIQISEEWFLGKLQ